MYTSNNSRFRNICYVSFGNLFAFFAFQDRVLHTNFRAPLAVGIKRFKYRNFNMDLRSVTPYMYFFYALYKSSEEMRRTSIYYC
jgi:hypothetical protein